MNILFLTKMKDCFLKENNLTFDKYLHNDPFFDGYYKGFKKQGHQLFHLWNESWFFPPFLKLKFPFIYKSLGYLSRRIGLQTLDTYLLSKKIAKYCIKHNIDFIFTDQNPYISPNIIRQYAPKAIITEWFGIFPEMADQWSLKRLPEYDIIWSGGKFDINKVDFNGIEKMEYIGCSVNENLLYHEFDKHYQYDIIFIGRLGKGHSNRLAILETIAEKFDNFAFYGYGDTTVCSKILMQKYKGWADARTTRKLYSSSKIILNLTLDGYDRITKGFNARLFEIPACQGGVQILKSDQKAFDYFKSNKELLCFHNIEELLEKIKYYLNNEIKRKQIVDTAYKRSLFYTYYERSKLMITPIKEKIREKHNV